MEDITERVHSEEALRQSEELFQQLFDSMAEGVDYTWRWNITGFRLCQHQGQKGAGRPPRAAAGGGRPADHRGLSRGGADGAPGGPSPRLDDLPPERHPLTQYADGRVTQWVEDYVYKLPSGLIVAIFSDTSESHRAEAERERLMAAIEQAGEMVLITDVAGNIQYVNPAFEAATGYARQEALGKNPRMLQSGEQDAFYRGLWQRISAGGAGRGRWSTSARMAGCTPKRPRSRR